MPSSIRTRQWASRPRASAIGNDGGTSTSPCTSPAIAAAIADQRSDGSFQWVKSPASARVIGAKADSAAARAYSICETTTSPRSPGRFR